MQATHPSYRGAHPELVATSPARQAYQALHIGFIVAPILAGLDKFTNLLTDWTQYLAPSIANLLPFSAQTFMHVVGVVEIVAGLLVAVRPRIGGYVVSAWLIGIILNLLIHTERFYDIALRDLGLAIGAFALARLSTSLGKK
jgi:uncharacterized membrane protein YphA (DoxX/SURF4 family)